MKRLLSAAIAAAAVAATPAPASAACPATIEWRGTTYFGIRAPDDLKAGKRLHGGVLPACNDTVIVDEHGNHAPPQEQDTPIELRRIRRVPARVALLAPSHPESVYLAVGFLPQLASHPLHDRLHPDGLNERAGRRCGPLRRLRGTLPWEPGPTSRFAVDDGRAEHDLTVDARTRVRGAPRIGGTPRFRAGDHVIVAGRTCRRSDDTVFVARHIRARRAR